MVNGSGMLSHTRYGICLLQNVMNLVLQNPYILVKSLKITACQYIHILCKWPRMHYMGLCTAHPYLFWLYLIVVIKSEIWIISHFFTVRHNIIVCTVCLAIFSLVKMLYYLINPVSFSALAIYSLHWVVAKLFSGQSLRWISVAGINKRLWIMGMSPSPKEN